MLDNKDVEADITKIESQILYLYFIFIFIFISQTDGDIIERGQKCG